MLRVTKGENQHQADMGVSHAFKDLPEFCTLQGNLSDVFQVLFSSAVVCRKLTKITLACCCCVVTATFISGIASLKMLSGKEMS